jgi:hypothetical protein
MRYVSFSHTRASRCMILFVNAFHSRGCLRFSFGKSTYTVDLLKLRRSKVVILVLLFILLKFLCNISATWSIHSNCTLITVYTTIIRPVLEYACQVWHYNIQQYLCEDIEKIQKRALRIILPSQKYDEALITTNITSLRQ